MKLFVRPSCWHRKEIRLRQLVRKRPFHPPPHTPLLRDGKGDWLDAAGEEAALVRRAAIVCRVGAACCRKRICDWQK